MAARNPFASSLPDIYDPYAPRASRPPLSTGYYFIRNLLIVGGVCGAFVAAYRNDVFRELARKLGQEPRYLATETLLVGTPGWGTPRSMEPVLAAEPGSAPVATPVVEAATTVAQASEPVAPSPAANQPVAAAPAAAPVAAAAPVPVDPLAPVSLDSLPVLGQSAAKPVGISEPAAAPAARAPSAESRPAPSAPVDRSRAKAIQVSLDDAPASASRSIPAPSRAAAPAPEPEPAPVAKKKAAPPPSGPKTTDVHKTDNPLMAAVRGAVRARPPKETVPPAE